MNEQRDYMQDLIAKIDKLLVAEGCGVLDALNAVTIMSSSLAHSVGLAQREYIDVVSNMFNQTKPLSDTHQEPVEEDENE